MTTGILYVAVGEEYHREATISAASNWLYCLRKVRLSFRKDGVKATANLILRALGGRRPEAS